MTLTIHMRRRERFTAFHACKCRGVISLGTNPRHPTSTGNPNDPTYETYETYEIYEIYEIYETYQQSLQAQGSKVIGGSDGGRGAPRAAFTTCTSVSQ